MLVLGLLASFSRAGAVAAFLGLLVWFWNSRQHLQRGLLAALVLAGLVLVSPLEPLVQSRLLPRNPLERGSVEDRLALDRSALSEGRAHLPLGTGAENYGLVALAEDRQEVFGEPVPNLALLIGAELGVPGVLALLLLGLGVWLSLRTAGPGGRAALAGLVAVVVLGMLDHYLWTMPPARLMAWLPLALLAATRARKVTHDL